MDAVDELLKAGAGHPMPLALVDLIGLDVTVGRLGHDTGAGLRTY